MARILFITGTDTGVGKTVLTALLVRHLRTQGVNAIALKPVCSGGREDARVIHSALDGAVTLDEVNPWHFRAPIAPLLTARREGRKLSQAQIVMHTRRMAQRFDVVIVEGAGGLLSPMGEGFDARSLITSLHAQPIVVASNRLGAVNQVRLVMAALPAAAARGTQVVLVNTARPDAASASNASLLGEFLEADRIHVLPRLRESEWMGRTALRPAAHDVLCRLAS